MTKWIQRKNKGDLKMINPIITSQYEDRILELIDNRDEYTRGDLQGIVSLLVNEIMAAGQDMTNTTNANK
jgi:hypothetical protein